MSLHMLSACYYYLLCFAWHYIWWLCFYSYLVYIGELISQYHLQWMTNNKRLVLAVECLFWLLRLFSHRQQLLCWPPLWHCWHLPLHCWHTPPEYSLLLLPEVLCLCRIREGPLWPYRPEATRCPVLVCLESNNSPNPFHEPCAIPFSQ